MNSKQRTLSRLGYRDYRPLQEEAIDALCSGQDVLLAAPTGGGKSLVYQAAGMLRQGVAVIVSPLLALMSQQVTELNRKGIQAKFLNSTLNPGEQDDLVWALRHNHVDLLFISPEKLVQPSVIGFLHSFEIALFAIDEAHCIAQWGSFFRPEYSQLGQLREHFPHAPIVALTGTVDQKTITRIQDSLKMKDCLVLKTSFDRNNIEIHIAQKRKAKQQVLYFLHYEVPGDTGIIYCRSRKKTEALADWLSQLGFPSLSYHASMSEAEKQQNHKTFVEQPGTIMVATTAYGMGMDIAHVRFVVHFDLPDSPESYFQEVGRAGRDGKASKALLLYGLQDMLQAQQFALQATDQDRQAKARLSNFFQILEARGCRRKNLLAHFGEDIAPCQHCDRCLSPVTEQNMTIAGQKLLSLIYHTKGLQPFSVLIQILLGKKTKATSMANAESFNLFGKGKELTEAQWKSVVRYLLAYHFISIEQGHLLCIQLNEKSRALLRGEVQILIPQERYYPVLNENLLSIDALSWHRVMRWKKTNKQIPLSDSQLRLIYQHKPSSVASLSRLTGLSKEDVAQFGESLLYVIHNQDSQEDQAVC